MRLWVLVCAGAVCSAAAGCASPGVSRRAAARGSVARYEGVAQEAVFAAAEAALGEHFRIERSDPASGTLVAAPKESTEHETAPSLRQVRGGRERLRRMAEVHVERAGGGSVLVSAVVLIQKLDTEARRTFSREFATRDTPTETPIDQEAGATPEQLETWTDRGRDEALERAILRAIDEKLQVSDSRFGP
ncbi:MAG TPA: hypothetical protein VGM03_06205 [Phycisphaerae bacterium]|jgi:hypothetical protein